MSREKIKMQNILGNKIRKNRKNRGTKDWHVECMQNKTCCCKTETFKLNY